MTKSIRRAIIIASAALLIFTVHQPATLAERAGGKLFDQNAPSELHPRGRRNPDAPKELDQFAFLVGEFDCYRHDFRKDAEWQSVSDLPWAKFLGGSDDAMKGVDFSKHSFTRWTATWILNGWGIMEEDVTESSIGFSICVYDEKKKQWDVTFFSPGFKGIWHGGLVDGNMIVNRREMDKGRRFNKRLIFFSIGPSGFKWTSEQALDDGGVESWGYIDCHRAN